MDAGLLQVKPSNSFRIWTRVDLRFLHSLQADKPNRILATAGHHPQPINQYSAGVLPPKGTSDHSLIFVKANAEPKTSSDVPFHRTIYRYNKVETTSDLTFPKHLFQLSSKTDLPRLPPPFLSGLSLSLRHWKLYPSQKYQKTPKDQLWFMLECAAVMSYGNHNFRLYQR